VLGQPQAWLVLALAPDTPFPTVLTAALATVRQAGLKGTVRVQLGPRDAQAWLGWVAAEDHDVTQWTSAEGTVWIGFGPTTRVEVEVTT
jgi:hypothetical protein